MDRLIKQHIGNLVLTTVIVLLCIWVGWEFGKEGGALDYALGIKEVAR